MKQFDTQSFGQAVTREEIRAFAAQHDVQSDTLSVVWDKVP